MLDYRQSVNATLSFDGVNELVRLTQDSYLGPDLGNFSLYRNGFLIENGFGPFNLGVEYERNFYTSGGYRITQLSGFANEVDETNYALDGSYTFSHFVDPGYTENLIVRADGSGEKTTVFAPFGDPEFEETIEYPAGTFDVKPLTPSVEATTRLQYAFDDQDRVSRLKIANEDGGYTIASFDYSGARLAERHLTYDAAGKAVEEARFDADGDLYYLNRNNADGSQTTTRYAPPVSEDAEPSRIGESVRYADGSSVDRVFDEDGTVTSTLVRQANGDAVKTFDDAAGSRTNTYLGGKLALGEVVATDGSKTAIAFQTSVTVEDTAGDDLFTAFGQDTFVFGKGGQDRVLNFHATGDLSDFVTLVGVEAEDFSVSMAGRNTVIQFDDDASITLTNVKMADVLDNILLA